MNFEIFKAYPPDRDVAMAQITYRHGGFVDISADVSRVEGELTITIFGREGGPSWEYPFEDWVGAVQRAAEALANETG